MGDFRSFKPAIAAVASAAAAPIPQLPELPRAKLERAISFSRAGGAPAPLP